MTFSKTSLIQEILEQKNDETNIRERCQVHIYVAAATAKGEKNI